MLRRLDIRLLVFILLACAVPLAFALYTGHAWEDYYITFRTSKNLATGQGLVFNVGERLHTFTSPLGVLLPAAASLLTLNTSDAVALWLFRLLSIAAFGTAAVLLFASASRFRYHRIAAVALVGWFITDLKLIDFSINGMETAFLLLFLTYAFWAIGAVGPRTWVHLGTAWGGLLWTRPDSFIYIGVFAGAIVLFNRAADTGATRRDWLKLFLRAGALATAIYGPWLVFAWGYFGSPVPHTIVAKATAGGPRSLAGLWHYLPDFPRRAWAPRGALEALFMPTYVLLGGWPAPLLLAGRIVGAAAALIWLLPGIRTETRAASFTLAAVLLYLTYYAPFIFPWYLCGPALLAFLALGGVLAQALGAATRMRWVPGRVAVTSIASAAALLILSTAVWLTWQGARQLKLQQALIEHGTRRAIGLWLHEQARPGDTVLLEPLGYIGYYSGLKTFDVPGLSSREVVAVIRQHGYSWGHVAATLAPDWMVLRPHEVEAIGATHPQVLAGYAAVRTYDLHDIVDRLPIHGRPYLAFDSRFTVFRRGAPAGQNP